MLSPWMTRDYVLAHLSSLLPGRPYWRQCSFNPDIFALSVAPTCPAGRVESVRAIGEASRIVKRCHCDLGSPSAVLVVWFRAELPTPEKSAHCP